MEWDREAVLRFALDCIEISKTWMLVGEDLREFAEHVDDLVHDDTEKAMSAVMNLLAVRDRLVRVAEATLNEASHWEQMIPEVYR